MEGDASGLPSPRTSLVGREADLETVGAALDRSRLVTVTGLGGVGKTRVAIEIAARLASTRRHGARLVGLAPLLSLDEVVTAISESLAPPAPPSGDLEPLERLDAALRDREVLLVLDNCEHLLAPVAAVADRLLETCPQLSVLTTSRAPLRVEGECVVAIAPLPVDPCTPAGPSAAARLFAERAARVRHDFVLDESNTSDVVEICRLVDGIPLAIELAAAHVDHLTTGDIRARLDERPGSVASRDRGAAARHRTLQATLDWSYFLLTEGERSVLRRMAVFVDGAPTGGIAAVAELPGDQVGEVIGRLVEKNLALADHRAGVSHYRLLDTVRRYAAARLEAAGELHDVRRRQAAWLVDQLTVGAADDGRSPSAAGPVSIADLTATVAWSLAAGETDLALTLAHASWQTWEFTGRHAEGRRLLAEVLGTVGDAPSVDRARVRSAAAQLAFLAGDLRAARSDYEQSIAELRELGAEAEVAGVLDSLAMVHLFDGDTGTARELASEALSRFRASEDEGGAAFAHTSLGMVDARDGRFEAAEWNFIEALRSFRRLGLKREAASVLDNLGNLATDLGQPGRAHRYFEGALQLQQQVGDDRGAAMSLNGLCLVAQQRGNVDRSWEHAEAARRLFQRIGDRTAEAATVNNLANLAAERGQPAEAMGLYGECIRAFRELGQPRRLATALGNLGDLARGLEERELAWSCLVDTTSLWNQLEEPVAVRQAAADLEELAAAWGIAAPAALADIAAGREQDPLAIGHAMEAARWTPIPAAPESTRPRAEGRLTAREEQVAGLVGRGLSNAEIAAELFISERTVDSHISNARTKLDIDSRTKLTRWAIEHGLAG